jgi:hypothetical protein
MDENDDEKLTEIIDFALDADLKRIYYNGLSGFAVNIQIVRLLRMILGRMV